MKCTYINTVTVPDAATIRLGVAVPVWAKSFSFFIRTNHGSNFLDDFQIREYGKYFENINDNAQLLFANGSPARDMNNSTDALMIADGTLRRKHLSCDSIKVLQFRFIGHATTELTAPIVVTFGD